MSWKFWQKDNTAAAPTGNKTQKLSKPRDLPQDVGRNLVVVQGLEPDWVWSLKCVVKPKDNSKTAFDIRIFSSETAAQHGVSVRDYSSLDNHMDLVIFAGWYDKESRKVQIERLLKEAV